MESPKAKDMAKKSGYGKKTIGLKTRIGDFGSFDGSAGGKTANLNIHRARMVTMTAKPSGCNRRGRKHDNNKEVLNKKLKRFPKKNQKKGCCIFQYSE